MTWSSDSKRILICEQGYNRDKGRESSYRVYDLAEKSQAELSVPSHCWVWDWSADGKRLLTTASLDGNVRIALINTDGSGELDYITSEEEIAYSPRLSPDGTRVLCMVAPKPKNGERTPARLCVINLSTNQRKVVDQPGETDGHCWSSDGAKIAYTWQRSLGKPSEVAERETLLITCRADGSDRKVITSRKYEVPENSSGRDGIVSFFTVLDWH